MMDNTENTPGQPLATGYGPASAALRAQVAQAMANGLEALQLDEGLRGGAGEDSGEEQQEQPSGRGHWGVVRVPSPRWTNEEDLELLRIVAEYPFWTADWIANELTLRMTEDDPNGPQRTENAVRQRRRKLEKSGVSIADLEARCKPKGKKGDGKKDGEGGGGGVLREDSWEEVREPWRLSRGISRV